ncbi:MAG: RNase adaptor protein RapZ, partial [Eubacterium sp.]|nr:RNase adaptor protein RapZ [Eubacterium sp.]
MRCVIVTGMSGAGKSTALNFFQDDGYYCVDNIPVQLISQCIRLAGSEETQIDRFAIGIDVRVGRTLERLDDVLRELKQQGIQISLLYLDADDRTLMRRYKESRITHQRASGGHLEAGI